MKSDELVQRNDDGCVAILRLNRPERRNALSRELMETLADAVDHAVFDPTIRSIVITGNGTVFCSGMDLGKPDAFDRPPSDASVTVDLRVFADLIVKIRNAPKPVIAALNGDAYAGGAGLAVACDFVIASNRAKIGYPETRRGLVAAIVAFELTRLVGARRSRELLLTGLPITAAEATRIGLINRDAEPIEVLKLAVSLGESLEECGPEALAETKRQLNLAESRPEELRGAAAISAAVRLSEEAEEGIRAFFEKRPPRWAKAKNGGGGDQ